MNTRKTIIAILAICVLAFSAKAQENGTLVKPYLPKNELKVSVGVAVSTDVGTTMMGVLTFFEPNFTPYQISLTYKNNLTPKSAITYSTTFIRYHSSVIYVNDLFFAFEIGYQYTYQRYKNLSLYSGISIGNVFWPSNKECSSAFYYWSSKNAVFEINHLFSYNVTLFGISLGKNNCADIELGLGTQGLLNIGYSCKF